MTADIRLAEARRALLARHPARAQRQRRHAPRRLAARVHAALRARAGVRGALPPEASLPRAPGAGRVAVRAAPGILVLRV